ncbi:hypothetical protein PLICRDRAFT_30829 [Plicaturopsis crispa FD-325 SS-3]|nr:hypothetical protein PLICRDRAFT_30829 [Plicaturopsis crispa FD-325 SS-3]
MALKCRPKDHAVPTDQQYLQDRKWDSQRPPMCQQQDGPQIDHRQRQGGRKNHPLQVAWMCSADAFDACAVPNIVLPAKVRSEAEHAQDNSLRSSQLYVLGYQVQGALAQYNRPADQADPLDATIRTLGQIAVDTRDVMVQNPMLSPLHNVLHWPRHLLRLEERPLLLGMTFSPLAASSHAAKQPPLVKQTPKITPCKPILNDGDAHTAQDNTGTEEPQGRTIDRKSKGKGKASPPADSDPVATLAQPTAVERQCFASTASTRSMRSRAMSTESTAAPDVEDKSGESDTSDMIVHPSCGWCKNKGLACVEHQGGKAFQEPGGEKAKKIGAEVEHANHNPRRRHIANKDQNPAFETTLGLTWPNTGVSSHHHEELPPPTTTPQLQNNAAPRKIKVGPPRGVKRPCVADGNVRPRLNMELKCYNSAHPPLCRGYQSHNQPGGHGGPPTA